MIQELFLMFLTIMGIILISFSVADVFLHHHILQGAIEELEEVRDFSKPTLLTDSEVKQ